jgi:uncharacterized protein YehS (DUF1456 family)
MTNNDILKKLRVALKLKDFEILEILKLSNFEMSKAELSALFRKEDHPNYQECGDQVLRKFLNGLITKNRGPRPEKKESKSAKPTEKRPVKTGRRIKISK